LRGARVALVLGWRRNTINNIGNSRSSGSSNGGGNRDHNGDYDNVT